MGLMERVSTLVRANLNDLIDKAEDPEKLLQQIMLDMHNQLMQVKTQVAMAIADQQLLARKLKEHDEKAAEWVRKAELAVEKKQDDLARAALDRSLSCQSTAAGFRQQVQDQTVQVENLKAALRKLQDKLTEANARCDLLAAQHRRARALVKNGEARAGLPETAGELALDRTREKVAVAEALGQVMAEVQAGTLEDRLRNLEKEDEIERLLAGIKARKTPA